MSLQSKVGVLDPSGSVLAATEETSWDWFNKYVERASFPDDIVTSQSALIMAGPAIFAELSAVGAIGGISTSVNINQSSLLTPIGFAQDFRYQEMQPSNRHFEIGSGRAKFTIGKSSGSGSISRALFDADSLLVVLTRNASKAQGTPHVDTFFKNSSNFKYGFGLSSDAFKIPFGIANAYKTIGNDFVASTFLEQCYIREHRVVVSEGAALIMENITFEFDRVRNVNIRVGGPVGLTDNNA